MRDGPDRFLTGRLVFYIKKYHWLQKHTYLFMPSNVRSLDRIITCVKLGALRRALRSADGWKKYPGWIGSIHIWIRHRLPALQWGHTWTLPSQPGSRAISQALAWIGSHSFGIKLFAFANPGWHLETLPNNHIDGTWHFGSLRANCQIEYRSCFNTGHILQHMSKSTVFP